MVAIGQRVPISVRPGPTRMKTTGTQDRHVITFLAERAYLSVVDDPLAWNYLVRAIMRHRKMTEADARTSDWLQRRNFMLVDS